ncbi:MAG TPA: hypothetical protein VGB79_13360 [Allosphingosinicella sp.]
MRRALRETLRHDFGPDRTRYFEECEARLDLIERACGSEPPMGSKAIADRLHELARIAVRVALIERSHVGEFFWPFTDIIRGFAEELFREEELFPLDPITHVVAEGTGYQVVDDHLPRAGTRRILVIAFPRQLKHHVLIHAIFGHELGHPAGRTDDSGAIAKAVLENMKAGPLANRATAKAWIESSEAPEAVKEERLENSQCLPTTTIWRPGEPRFSAISSASSFSVRHSPLRTGQLWNPLRHGRKSSSWAARPTRPIQSGAA